MCLPHWIRMETIARAAGNSHWCLEEPALNGSLWDYAEYFSVTGL